MWTITQDELYNKGIDEKSCKGVSSRNFDKAKFNEFKKQGKVYKFKMLDGDDNIYYYGYCTSNDDEVAFAPLDDFGKAYAGCTSIWYKNPVTGKYEEL